MILHMGTINIGLGKFVQIYINAIAVMINITLFLVEEKHIHTNYMQSLPSTTTFSNMQPLQRTRLAKQQAPQRKRKHREASNHDSDEEVANTRSSPNNTFHNIDTMILMTVINMVIDKK